MKCAIFRLFLISGRACARILKNLHRLLREGEQVRIAVWILCSRTVWTKSRVRPWLREMDACVLVEILNFVLSCMCWSFASE